MINEQCTNNLCIYLLSWNHYLFICLFMSNIFLQELNVVISFLAISFCTIQNILDVEGNLEKIEHHYNSYWVHLRLLRTNYATAVVQLIIKQINVFQALHNYMFSWNGSLIYKQLCLARSLRSWRKMVQNLALPNTG